MQRAEEPCTNFKRQSN